MRKFSKWSAHVNLYQALLPEEKKKQPAYAAKVDPLVAALGKETDAVKRIRLRAAIQKALLAIDAARFKLGGSGHFEAHFGMPYFDAFNKMYPELARQFGLPLFPDYLDATYGHPELFHEGEAVAPNADGVKVIIAKMLPMVKELLENVDKP